jgi:hypothetical protein
MPAFRLRLRPGTSESKRAGRICTKKVRQAFKPQCGCQTCQHRDRGRCPIVFQMIQVLESDPREHGKLFLCKPLFFRSVRTRPPSAIRISASHKVTRPPGLSMLKLWRYISIVPPRGHRHELGFIVPERILLAQNLHRNRRRASGSLVLSTRTSQDHDLHAQSARPGTYELRPHWGRNVVCEERIDARRRPFHGTGHYRKVAFVPAILRRRPD